MAVVWGIPKDKKVYKNINKIYFNAYMFPLISNYCIYVKNFKEMTKQIFFKLTQVAVKSEIMINNKSKNKYGH